MRRYEVSVVSFLHKAGCFRNASLLVLVFFAHSVLYAGDSPLAWKYLEQGKYSEAERCFKEEVKSRPDSAEGYKGMGRVYSEQHKYNEALKWLKKGLKIDAGNADICIEIGRVYDSMNDGDEAAKWFRQAVKGDPYNTHNYLVIGDIYMNRDKYSAALAWFEEALKNNPGNSDLCARIAIIYEMRNNYDAAIDWNKKAVKSNPGNANAYYNIAMIYWRVGNYKEALKWGKESVKRDPKGTNGYIALGRIYEYMGNLDEAEKWYREAIRVDPNEARGHNGIGDLYRRRDKPQEALDWYNKSMEVGSQNKQFLCPYEGLGLLYKKLGNTAKAEETFLAKIQKNPNYLSYYDFAYYYYNMGQFGKARDNIEKALSLVPEGDEQSLLLLKGFILIMQGESNPAEQVFNDLIKKYGVDSGYGFKCAIFSGLGYVANAKKDYKTARKYFEDALDSKVKAEVEYRSIAQLGLGWVNANEHKYKEAISCYEKVLKEDPLLVLALLGMSDAYEGLGSSLEADKYLKHAIKLNPRIDYKKYCSLIRGGGLADKNQ